MSKSIPGQLASTRKFLEKYAKSNLNLKQAQAALSEAEKVHAELASLKARLGELTEARKGSMLALEEAMARVKLEKKLKGKEARVQAKLAVLASPSGSAK
jgi:hypothetical protein